MKHPAILLLPVLMFTDYLLTVAGAVQREKRYTAHFKLQHYELNPVWQKAISRKQWFNPRHLLLTIVASGLLAWVMQWEYVPDFFAEGAMGCLFVFFAAIIGRHVSNLLVFRRLTRSPNEISGQLRQDYSLTLSISSYQYMATALPVVIIAIFSPSPFTVGGVVGIILIFSVHGLWIRRHRKSVSKLQKAALETPLNPVPAEGTVSNTSSSR